MNFDLPSMQVYFYIRTRRWIKTQLENTANFWSGFTYPGGERKLTSNIPPRYSHGGLNHPDNLSYGSPLGSLSGQFGRVKRVVEDRHRGIRHKRPIVDVTAICWLSQHYSRRGVQPPCSLPQEITGRPRLSRTSTGNGLAEQYGYLNENALIPSMSPLRRGFLSPSRFPFESALSLKALLPVLNPCEPLKTRSVMTGFQRFFGLTLDALVENPTTNSIELHGTKANPSETPSTCP